MLRNRRRMVVVAALVALLLPAAADAKLALTFDRTSARPGDRLYLTFGKYFTSKDNVVHVYIVHAPILGTVLRPAAGGGTVRLGPPPRRSGVHKVGRTVSGKPGLAFRVPAVRAGRYAAVIWCSTCRYKNLLASFDSGIPDDAFVRQTRSLLSVQR